MYILGISALYHDSAACLLDDGVIVAAAQEERFSRIKHDPGMPRAAVRYCLAEAGITPAELDCVAFYEKPLAKFDRLLETYLSYAPAGLASFMQAMPLWLNDRLHLPRQLDELLDHRYGGRYVFSEHHLSHGASAFFPSPFTEAAVLTLDGVGEWATACFGVGRGNRIELSDELRFPHSLGLLYSAFTHHSGFEVNRGEYKLMGLAPYGVPRFREVILKELVDLKDDGSFRLNMAYFSYPQGLTMTNRRFDGLFEGPRRTPEGPITEREMDLAASIQAVAEEILLRTARHVARTTGATKLCMAGGVALNCVANHRILEQGIFDELWIQPAAGDAGGALGAALLVWHQLLDEPRRSEPGPDRQQGSLLGPAFDDRQMAAAVAELGLRAHRHDSEDELLAQVAELIDQQQVVGHVHGRMEFGPRALGARSILADARSEDMQSVLNQKIKRRESFRPFAPSVLGEQAARWFDLPDGQDSPYMLLVAPVRAEHRVAEDSAAQPRGLERLHLRRSTIPAVTHVDHSARVQTVDPQRNGRFHRLLSHVERRTGCPVVINTSFNVRGEPIVCSPEDALRCFLATEMDALVLGPLLLLKAEQPAAARRRRGSQVPPERRSRPSASGIQWRPDRRRLRRFGLFAAVAFAAFAALWGWDRPWPSPAWAVTLGCLLLSLYGLVGAALAPRTLRPLYLTLTVLTYPIGFVVSRLVLAAVYYGVLLPTGLLLRLLGRDVLHRSFDLAAPSYWLKRSPPADPKRYFRQF